MRQIYCQKLRKKADGLDFPPITGKIGQRIYKNISKQAWQEWISLQTMLINENRLNTLDSRARNFLREQMEAFFFGQGCQKPQGYVPEEVK